MDASVTAYAGTVESHGTLQIIKQAEQSGNPLSGAVFGVYRVSDNKKLIELTTDADGRASLYLDPGEYYLRELKPPYGYMLEPARIYFTVKSGILVKVEVTNQRDINISDNNAPGIISIPKTGEDFLTANIVFGVLLIFTSLICCVWLFCRKDIAN